MKVLLFVKHALVAGLVAGLLVGGWLLPLPQTAQPNRVQTFGADNVNPVAGATYNLSGAGVSPSAVSIVLASLTLPQTGQELADSDFSSTFYLTLEPGNRARQEIVSCTTVAQGAGTTATLSGCTRGLSPITPFTASSTLQFSHGGGTPVIFSDPPQLFNQFSSKTNDETITGLWDYSSTTPPRYDLVPLNHNSGTIVSTTSEFASVAYVNATGAGANVSATEAVRGEVELATALESGSSTATGGTGASLVLRAAYATDTPQNCTTVGCIVVSQIGGKIRQTFLDLTQNFTWTGLHTFVGGVYATSTRTDNATTSIQSITNYFSAASSTPSWNLASTTIGSDLYIAGGLGVGAATTTNGDLLVTGFASTSALVVSKGCIGCTSWTGSSTSFAGISSATFTSSIPVNATVMYGNFTIEDDVSDFKGTIILARTGATSTRIMAQADGSGSQPEYDLLWNGANLVITEIADDSTTLTGNFYWYQQ